MTKLSNYSTQKQNIPAGIFSGIEAFWHENKKMVIANGTTYHYNDAPTTVKSTIQRAFLNDRQSLAYISKIGIKTIDATFDRWYRCVVGGWDSEPDFMENRFTPDAYNNLCADHSCPHRGRLCSRATGLKSHEVETIVALKQGGSFEQTASVLCVSRPAVNSRVEKMKEKAQVHNIVELMAWACQLGV